MAGGMDLSDGEGDVVNNLGKLAGTGSWSTFWCLEDDVNRCLSLRRVGINRT